VGILFLCITHDIPPLTVHGSIRYWIKNTVVPEPNLSRHNRISQVLKGTVVVEPIGGLKEFEGCKQIEDLIKELNLEWKYQ